MYIYKKGTPKRRGLRLFCQALWDFLQRKNKKTTKKHYNNTNSQRKRADLPKK